MTEVFLHGLGQGPESWGPLGREALCPDLFALPREGGLCYPGLYQALCAYCEELSPPLRLCGLSLGGVLALQYALEYPERVESLVLIGTPCAMPKGLLRFQSAVFRLMPERAFRAGGLSKKETLELTGSMVDLDFRGELGRIACPALILCGERDRANKKAALELRDGIPGAELAWVPGAGHEVNREAPEALAALLEAFYRRRGEGL